MAFSPGLEEFGDVECVVEGADGVGGPAGVEDVVGEGFAVDLAVVGAEAGDEEGGFGELAVGGVEGEGGAELGGGFGFFVGVVVGEGDPFGGELWGIGECGGGECEEEERDGDDLFVYHIRTVTAELGMYYVPFCEEGVVGCKLCFCVGVKC